VHTSQFVISKHQSQKCFSCIHRAIHNALRGKKASNALHNDTCW